MENTNVTNVYLNNASFVLTISITRRQNYVPRIFVRRGLKFTDIGNSNVITNVH